MAKSYKNEDEVNEVKGYDKKNDLLSFNVWFSSLIMKEPKVKAQHMSAIRAHFKSIGISELEIEETFADALKHYGI